MTASDKHVLIDQLAEDLDLNGFHKRIEVHAKETLGFDIPKFIEEEWLKLEREMGGWSFSSAYLVALFLITQWERQIATGCV